MSSRSEGGSSSSKRPSSSSKASSSTSSSSSKPKTVEAVLEAEYEVFVKTALETHLGYLAKPLISLATSLDVSTLHLCYLVGGFYSIFHLVLPVFITPHYSALITLIIPVQNTLRSISLENNKKTADDAPQWCVYWVIYCLFELARGWVGIFRPGYRAQFEVVRTMGLIIVGGPWFGKAGLRPGPPSEELREAEKREAEEAKKQEAEKKKSKEKDKKNSEKKDKGKDDAKDKDRYKEKDKGKSRDKEKERGKDEKKSQ